MRRAIKNGFFTVLMTILVFPTSIFSQEQNKSFSEFVEYFPEHYLPFSIAENELTKLDRTSISPIPKEFLHFLPQSFSSVDLTLYAYAAIDLENGKTLLFHLEESKYPFVRKVYMTVFSAEGFPEATELFASYERDFGEIYTYAIVNSQMVMHRTTKRFEPQKNEVKIRTDKFRLNNIGEIVAL